MEREGWKCTKLHQTVDPRKFSILTSSAVQLMRLTFHRLEDSIQRLDEKRGHRPLTRCLMFNSLLASLPLSLYSMCTRTVDDCQNTPRSITSKQKRLGLITSWRYYEHGPFTQHAPKHCDCLEPYNRAGWECAGIAVLYYELYTVHCRAATATITSL